ILYYHCAALRLKRKPHIVLGVPKFKRNVLSADFRDLRVGNVKRKVALRSVLKVCRQPSLRPDVDTDKRGELLGDKDLVNNIHGNSLTVLIEADVMGVIILYRNVQTQVVRVAVLQRVGVADDGIRRGVGVCYRNQLESIAKGRQLA